MKIRSVIGNKVRRRSKTSKDFRFTPAYHANAHKTHTLTSFNFSLGMLATNIARIEVFGTKSFSNQVFFFFLCILACRFLHSCAKILPLQNLENSKQFGTKIRLIFMRDLDQKDFRFGLAGIEQNCWLLFLFFFFLFWCNGAKKEKSENNSITLHISVISYMRKILKNWKCKRK